MANEAIEAAKARAAEIRAQNEKPVEPSRDGVVTGELSETIPLATAPVIPKGTNLSRVDLDALDPNSTTNPALQDMAVREDIIVAADPTGGPDVGQTGVLQPFTPVSPVTSNLGGVLTQGNHPLIPQSVVSPTGVQDLAMTELRQAIQDEQIQYAKQGSSASPFKTYKHLYAGANTIMPDGKRLTFGGHPGGNGYYTTQDPAEQMYLDGMCRQVSSQISKENDNLTPEVTTLLAQSATDARVNTQLDVDPRVATARANLPNAIAADGRGRNF